MSNNKKNSVEWFAHESWKLRVELEDGKISFGEYANKYYQLKEQAKAMHREEIIDATCLNDYVNEDDREIGDQYYNETFGGEE